MKLTRIATMLGMLVFAVTATSCTHHKSGDTAATTSSSAAATSTRPPLAPVTGPALPPFFPSPAVGANCQYLRSSDPAAKAAPAPAPGKASADPAQVGLTVVTDRGRIGLQLANNESPCTVNSFVTLAQGAYFDNTECHRLTTSRTLS
ncbi:peptidylprolyl isomerase, partial [Mycobacterium sp.]|uniref:peptidylprolyl isomerase n=1 Tax=Mycobacterium sp. TaxID=1785 RepID=UPI003BB04487